MNIIAHIRTDFKTKFGIPRQPGIVVETLGVIEFEKEYQVWEAFRRLEEFSHIWLIWEFSETKRDSWKPTVRPPMLGGNERVGVFATRSPFRPNSIGLSAVRLEKIEFSKEKGPLLYVSGADLADGTPIYDIKPYLPYADSISGATGGFTDGLPEKKLEVCFPDAMLKKIPCDKIKALIAVLSCDPRPSYITDSNRVYGFVFSDYEIKFSVCGNRLRVTEVIKVS